MGGWHPPHHLSPPLIRPEVNVFLLLISSCWTVSLSGWLILEWMCFNDWAKSRYRRNLTYIILLDFLQSVLTVLHRDVCFIN